MEVHSVYIYYVPELALLAFSEGQLGILPVWQSVPSFLSAAAPVLQTASVADPLRQWNFFSVEK